MSGKMFHHLYRHFDKYGKLLYVGISLHAMERLRSHSISSEWFKEIAEVKIEHFESREQARQAERSAIATEKPVHNIHGQRDEDQATLEFDEPPPPPVSSATQSEPSWPQSTVILLFAAHGTPLLSEKIKQRGRGETLSDGKLLVRWDDNTKWTFSREVMTLHDSLPRGQARYYAAEKHKDGSVDILRPALDREVWCQNAIKRSAFSEPPRV